MGMFGGGKSAVAWFRCLIRAENFPGQFIGEAGLLGFYTNRFVEANDAKITETDVLHRFRKETRLAAPTGCIPAGQVKVYFQEIEEIAVDKVPPARPGISWYRMENRNDNEGCG